MVDGHRHQDRRTGHHRQVAEAGGGALCQGAGDACGAAVFETCQGSAQRALVGEGRHRQLQRITDYHPRYEDPASIRASLIAGARAAVPDREIHEVPDPATAIRAAVSLVGEGDTILVAGPGHEDYHEVAGVKIPFSARDDARAALRDAGWS